MITSDHREETLFLFTNLIGSDWTDTSYVSTDTSSRALSRATLKIIASGRYWVFYGRSLCISILKTTAFPLTNKSNKTVGFLRGFCWRERRLSTKMANSMSRRISEWAMSSRFMEKWSDSSTAMNTRESSTRSWECLRDQLRTIRRMPGKRRPQRNGFHKKMLPWRSISKKN